ncbi:MAG: hypothetical protein LBI90_03600, partial [Treponema sp.]|nr:hypothetical protein [Treponema sp.]
QQAPEKKDLKIEWQSAMFNYWKLLTSGYGEAARYGTHLAYSLAEQDWGNGDVMGVFGDAMRSAYDDMGGITLNVANIGAMLDFMATAVGRAEGGHSETADALYGASKYVDVGVLELTLGRDGVQGRIGTGGIDVGGSLYDVAKRGLDYAGMMAYAKGTDNQRAVLKNYIYGDFTQENTSARIASGVDILTITDNDGDGLPDGNTVRDEKDSSRRIIEIEDQGNINNTAVVLGHESYRDGLEAVDNTVETRQAVLAHTQMAALMRTEVTLNTGGSLGLELALYDYAMETGDWSVFDRYVDKAYDSSGDFWKLTDDGKLLFDGRATVTSAETGKELISLESLGMDDDSDYTTSLAKLLGIGNEKAVEIINNMWNTGSASIQLGNAGGGLNAGDYIDALRYSLSSGPVSDFALMNGNQQINYLKNKVIVGSAYLGKDKGDTARDLRKLRDQMILKELFKKDTILSKLFTNNEYGNRRQFMNENLRDFMNLNTDGTMNYTLDELQDKENGWNEVKSWGSAYHQTNADVRYLNAKFVHPDGREIVIDFKENVVSSYPDKGTYNYVNATIANTLFGGAHDKYDVKPFKELGYQYRLNFYFTNKKNSEYWPPIKDK